MEETIKLAMEFGEKSMLTNVLIEGMKLIKKEPNITALDLLNKLKNLDESN